MQLWPLVFFLCQVSTLEVAERIDNNVTSLHPVPNRIATLKHHKLNMNIPKNETTSEVKDNEAKGALDATVWRIEASLKNDDERKEENNTEAEGSDTGRNETFKPSPHAGGILDADSQEQPTKGGYGYLPPSIAKIPPSKFKSASPFDFPHPFNHFKFPKPPHKFPYKYESPIYLKMKTHWKPGGGPLGVESQEPTSIVPAGGYYGLPDAFKEGPVYIEDPEQFYPYGEYGPHALKHHGEIPWRRLLHLMTALIPVGLIISALTPHVITVENVTPAPPPAPNRYPNRRRRSDQSLTNPPDIRPIRPLSGAPQISERCRRRLLCELYSEQHYTQKAMKSSLPQLSIQCSKYRCEDPRVVAKVISWMLAPKHQTSNLEYHLT